MEGFNLPAWVLPWAAEIPVPGPHAGVGQPLEVRSGVYAAFYTDGRLRCVGMVFHGRLQEYLWLSPDHTEGFAASGPPWWVAQAYYHNQTVQDFSPGTDPSRRRPAGCSCHAWTSRQLSRILDYGTRFHTPRVPPQTRLDAWQDLVTTL